MHAIKPMQAPNAIRRLVTQTYKTTTNLHSLPRALIAARGTFSHTPTASLFAARNGFSTSARLATIATTDLHAELLEGVTFGKEDGCYRFFTGRTKMRCIYRLPTFISLAHCFRRLSFQDTQMRTAKPKECRRECCVDGMGTKHQVTTIITSQHNTTIFYVLATIGDAKLTPTVTTYFVNSLRKFSDELIFLPLRDSSGTIQLVLKNSSKDSAAQQSLQDLTPESVICVEGKVVARDASTINPKMATGHIEIELSSVRILNKTHKSLPFLPSNQELVSLGFFSEHGYHDCAAIPQSLEVSF
jgi:hypothetical protein